MKSKMKFDFWAIPAIIPAALFIPLPIWACVLIAVAVYLLRNLTLYIGTFAVIGLNVAALIFAVRYVPAWFSIAYFVLFAAIMIIEIGNLVLLIKANRK